MTRVISKPLGRPVSTGRGDAVRVTVRLSEQEAADYTREATAEGMTLAAYIREAARIVTVRRAKALRAAR